MNLQNPIWIAGEIREDPMFVQFTRRLSELLATTKRGTRLTVLINSSGGETQTTLGIYDMLVKCDRKVAGVVVGRAQSGASLILQACQQRVMTVHSTLMLHRSSVRIGGTVENAEAALKWFRHFDERFYAIYAERSGKNSASIAEMANRDVHFSAEQALEAGLIDEIL